MDPEIMNKVFSNNKYYIINMNKQIFNPKILGIDHMKPVD